MSVPRALLALLVLLALSWGPQASAAEVPEVHQGTFPLARSHVLSPTDMVWLRLSPGLGPIAAAHVEVDEPAEPSPAARTFVRNAFERTWLASGLGLGIAFATTTWTWQNLPPDSSPTAPTLRWTVAIGTHLFFPTVLASIVNPAPVSINLQGAIEGLLFLGGGAAIGVFAGAVVVLIELFAWAWSSLVVWESTFDVLAIIGPSFRACFWVGTGLGYLASSFGVPWRFRRWAKRNPEVIEARLGPTVYLDHRGALPGLQLSIGF